MRVAVVGLGYWGPNHVRNLLAIEACTELVVVDLDRDRAEAVAAGHRKVTVASDLTEVLADPLLDAVVLSTPVDTHVPLAQQVLEAGKSILVEKPLATSAADAIDLVELARRQNVLLSCGHTFLYSPPVVTISKIVRSGELGRLLYLQGSRVNLGIHNSNVNVLWDLGPHDLSILLAWVDERPSMVAASGRSSHPGQPPDVAFMTVHFPSGFVANLHLSWLAPTKIRRTTLVGTRKMVVYEDNSSEEPVKIYDKGVDFAEPHDFADYRLTYRTGDIVAPHVPAWEPLRRELEDFLDRVAARELPDAREQRVIDVVRIIEAADTSLQQHGQPVVL